MKQEQIRQSNLMLPHQPQPTKKERIEAEIRSIEQHIDQQKDQYIAGFVQLAANTGARIISHNKDLSPKEAFSLAKDYAEYVRDNIPAYETFLKENCPPNIPAQQRIQALREEITPSKETKDKVTEIIK